jgi:hypothetical protein
MKWGEKGDVQTGGYPKPRKTAHETRFSKKYFFLVEYQYSTF